VCNNARVSRDGERPTARRRQVRLAGPLALLLAVSVLTATATTSTTSARTGTDGARPNYAVAVFTHLAGHDATASTADLTGDVQRDGPDNPVRVVKKVRAVFLPHGSASPILVMADVTPTARVTSGHDAAPPVAVAAYGHPRRGPPVTGPHSFS
jgi:hypothetical protein